MQSSVVLVFVLTCIPLVLAPGPSVAFVLATTLSSGRWIAMSAVAGVELGYVAHVIAAAAGISAILAASAAAFTAVKIAGACYLVWLGIRVWRSRDLRLLGELGSAGGAARPGAAFRRGLVIGVLNPKTAVFFLSFLPQFVRPDAGPAWFQMTMLGLLFIVLAAVPDTLWALGGGAVARLFPRTRVRTTERISGTVFFGLAGYSLTARHA
jgi:threonine/homoserine/homoserine lactone efflux protein